MPLVSDHDDEHQRASAAVALAKGWPGDPDVLLLLRESATGDPGWRVREAAVRWLAIGWAGDPGVREVLCGRATGDEEENVRQTALSALASGWPDHPGTLSYLRDRAVNDHDPYVRREALRALSAGWSDDPDTAPFLFARAVSDASDDVSRYAFEYTDPTYARDPRAVKVTAMYQASAGQRRRRAMETLARRWPDHPSLIPVLLDRAGNDDDWQLRKAAIQLVAAVRPADPETVPALLAAARHEQWEEVGTGDFYFGAEYTDSHEVAGELRISAIEALAAGWPEHPETLPLLRDRAVNDRSSAVREAARRAIDVAEAR
jgi:HEAT repeat protein